MIRLAVIGDPVEHSASPALHRSLLEQAGLTGTYEAIRVPAGEGARAIARLRGAGYHGLNVTTPLKGEGFASSDRRDSLAEASRSVNTVVFEDGAACGYNTDGAGAVGAVQDATKRASIAGLAVLVLGAGPTARASSRALSAAGASVALWNRTRPRAEATCDELGVALWHRDARVDVVLATLPPMSSIDDDDLRRALLAAPIVIDANYGARATLGAALSRPVVDGLAMLRASARASFELFVRNIEAKGVSST